MGMERKTYHISMSLSCIMYHHHHPQCRKNTLHYGKLQHITSLANLHKGTSEVVKTWSQTSTLNSQSEWNPFFGRTVSCFYSVKDQRGRSLNHVTFLGKLSWITLGLATARVGTTSMMLSYSKRMPQYIDLLGRKLLTTPSSLHSDHFHFQRTLIQQ